MFFPGKSSTHNSCWRVKRSLASVSCPLWACMQSTVTMLGILNWISPRCGNIPSISINKIYGLEADGKWSPVAFKVADPFWEGCEVLKRPVPHGHNGKAVFEIKISHCGNISDISEINYGRDTVREMGWLMGSSEMLEVLLVSRLSNNIKHLRTND